MEGGGAGEDAELSGDGSGTHDETLYQARLVLYVFSMACTRYTVMGVLSMTDLTFSCQDCGILHYVRGTDGTNRITAFGREDKSASSTSFPCLPRSLTHDNIHSAIRSSFFG